LAHFLFVIDTAQSNIHTLCAKGSYGIFLIFNLHDVLSRRQRTMGVHLRREHAPERCCVFFGCLLPLLLLLLGDHVVVVERAKVVRPQRVSNPQHFQEPGGCRFN
jgi:hypothetical protein